MPCLGSTYLYFFSIYSGLFGAQMKNVKSILFLLSITNFADMYNLGIFEKHSSLSEIRPRLNARSALLPSKLIFCPKFPDKADAGGHRRSGKPMPAASPKGKVDTKQYQRWHCRRALESGTRDAFVGQIMPTRKVVALP